MNPDFSPLDLALTCPDHIYICLPVLMKERVDLWAFQCQIETVFLLVPPSFSMVDVCSSRCCGFMVLCFFLLGG